jgi:hypothetical protein
MSHHSRRRGDWFEPDRFDREDFGFEIFFIWKVRGHGMPLVGFLDRRGSEEGVGP